MADSTLLPRPFTFSPYVSTPLTPLPISRPPSPLLSPSPLPNPLVSASNVPTHPLSDIWLQGIAVVLGQVQQELDPTRIEFATLALYVGLIIGASTWGVLADVIGRKLSFNVSVWLLSIVHH